VKIVGLGEDLGPATTLDTNIRVDLPPRQYMRVLRLCQKLGATVSADTVVELSDGSMVNCR